MWLRLNMNYQSFAKVYDEVMDQSLYDDWVRFTENSIQQYGTPSMNTIMELACGTGEVAIKLAKEGYSVVGVDLSENMLAIANQKASQQHIPIVFAQADMRDLSEMELVDVVTLYSDSLCYLTDFEDVKKVFQTVYHRLNEQGLFLFDVHSLYQMNEVFPGFQYCYTNEDSAFIWESFEYDLPGSVEHVITMFLQSENHYERFEEVHVERSFSIAEYQQALYEVGFNTVNVQASFGDEEVQQDSPRWFFVCQKGS